jgi:hypothetical protein
VVRALPYGGHLGVDNLSPPAIGSLTGRLGFWVENFSTFGERIGFNMSPTGGALSWNTGLDVPLDAAGTTTATGKLPHSPLKPAGTRGVAARLDRATGKTAILYPILLDDRLELLWVHNGRIAGATVAAPREQVEEQAEAPAKILRTGRDYRAGARQFYRWLVAPVEKDLKAAGIDRIVYIPDGVLRLVPLAALGEDQDFVARHYAVITSSGLNCVAAAASSGTVRSGLLA